MNTQNNNDLIQPQLTQTVDETKKKRRKQEQEEDGESSDWD